MSADGYNACPACYHRATGVPLIEITQRDHLNKADEVGVDETSLREYYEVYLDQGFVVFEFHGAACPDCNYNIPAFTLRHELPGV